MVTKKEGYVWNKSFLNQNFINLIRAKNLSMNLILQIKILFLQTNIFFDPYFDQENCPAAIIYQENYGNGEPTDIMVDAIIQDASKNNYDRLIAIGGGTVIDIAKILAVTKGNNVDYLYEHKNELTKYHQLLIIPTTCGTGSEVTNISIINRTRLGVKMGLTSSNMFADYAILIPELLKTLPFKVFATSSIDALVHAVESSLSPKATAYTKLFGYKAIEMIITSYQKLVDQGKEILPDLMSDFLTASNFAGLAFGTAGCAAVHALSYPLGGTYHVPHGESNYAIFTGVLKNYKKIKTDGELAVMEKYLANLLNCNTDMVYDKLEALLNQILPKKALHEYGVTKQDLNDFTDNVINTQERLMANNFVPLNRQQIYQIYQELY